jgi:hypothetical protein
MTSKEFVIWLKGFVAAANSYNITPQQFHIIMEELNKIEDNNAIWTTTYSVPNSTEGITTVTPTSKKTLLD